MKVAMVFFLLFATVRCYPVKRSASSSEEVLKLAPTLRNTAPTPKQTNQAQSVIMDDSSHDRSDEWQDSDPSSDTSSDMEAEKQDSEDSADHTDKADRNETDSEESDESKESGETETTFPSTAQPGLPTILPTFSDQGRGDSVGYPSDYKKSLILVESNNIGKNPSYYKSYGKMEDNMQLFGMKKSDYDLKDGNEVKKHLKVFKALQMHGEIVEEDTSTPEVDSQGMETSNGSPAEPNNRQAVLGSQETALPQSDGAIDGLGADSSQSSEEATTHSHPPGAADSDSSQSSESQEMESASEESQTPALITAK